MAANPAYFNLGSPVSARTTSWLDLCIRAWGSEFQAPDHDVYNWSNGRHFDSTDRGLTGVYGVFAPQFLIIDGEQYPDMRDTISINIGLDKLGQYNPAGFGDDLAPDPATP